MKIIFGGELCCKAPERPLLVNVNNFIESMGLLEKNCLNATLQFDKINIYYNVY